MAAEGVGAAVAETLLERREELAVAITEALYRDRPELMDRYGEHGRRRCLEDMRYNLDHLAPAVALSEPGLFERYVVWLCQLLASRGIPAADVQRSLEITREVLQVRLADGQISMVEPVLEAGLRASRE